MERFIKRMAVIFYIVFAFLSPAVSSHYDALSSNRHSERKEEFFVEKTGNGMVTRSEESITLNGILPVFLTMVADPSHSLRMTPYRPSSF